MKITLKSLLILSTCLFSIAFSQASTDKVFSQLGWSRSDSNEQIVSTNKGKINFYEKTGFRIFMQETSPMQYDYIGKDGVDFEFPQLITTRGSVSELTIKFIHPYGDYKTRIENFESILSNKLAKLKVSYIPSSEILGGTLVATGNSFSDSSFMLKVLKTISSEMK